MGKFAKKAIQALQREEKIEGESFLNIPVRELKESLPVHSQILDEVIYLVPNEEMARHVEDEGKVAYTPEEIAVLSRKSKTMDWGEWVDFLKMLHHTKKTFLSSRIQS